MPLPQLALLHEGAVVDKAQGEQGHRRRDKRQEKQEVSGAVGREQAREEAGKEGACRTGTGGYGVPELGLRQGAAQMRG